MTDVQTVRARLRANVRRRRRSSIQLDRLFKRFTRALAFSIVCAAAFGCIALLIGIQAIAAFDSAVIGAVQGLEAAPLTAVMNAFTQIGAGPAVAVITVAVGAFLYKALGHRKELLLLAVSVGGSALLNALLKLAFRRDRPTLHRIGEATGYSFPSGHSMTAFCLYGTLAYLLWNHIPGTAGRTVLVASSALFILAIGISRIYLGVHYPSDVIGGYLASGCWLLGLIWAYSGFGRRSAVTSLGDR
ncbi:phosphatase PAP2 family protein [Paenibacillus sp. GYB003]|uniref:phosphatase PAP2 family protein n=1 Tax=Paenibacillus sp. GYB003 TaxID=2994392 RepID=UPI002F9681EC